MPLGMEVGLGLGDFVFGGDLAPARKKGHTPTQFLAHVYCGQTSGWIKVPLGTEVNLGPGDVVFDGFAAPPIKGHSPQFSVHVYCGQMAGRMKTLLGTEVDLVPGHFVIDGDPAPPRKGHSSPLFSAHAYCGHGRPSQLLLSTCKDSCHGRSWLRVQRP